MCKLQIHLFAATMAGFFFVSCDDSVTQSSAREAAETKEAAEKLDLEKRELIGGVMDFLTNTKFYALSKRETEEFATIEKWQYSEFGYEPETQSLVFIGSMERSSNAKESGYRHIGDASSTLFMHRIYLPTASASIQIRDYETGIKAILFSCDFEKKALQKKGKAEDSNSLTAHVSRLLDAMPTDKDLDALKRKPWGERAEGRDYAFMVSEETSQRLKLAFEDLFKVHGVRMSKY